MKMSLKQEIKYVFLFFTRAAIEITALACVAGLRAVTILIPDWHPVEGQGLVT